MSVPCRWEDRPQESATDLFMVLEMTYPSGNPPRAMRLSGMLRECLDTMAYHRRANEGLQRLGDDALGKFLSAYTSP